MEWAEAGFRTSHEAVDAVSSLFEEAGASGTVIEDPALINDYIHSGLWDYTDIPEQKDTSVVARDWTKSRRGASIRSPRNFP